MSEHPISTPNDTDAIRDAVREAYGQRVSSGSSCCGGDPVRDAAGASRRMGYSEEDLASEAAVGNLGFGCGAPLAAAAVQPGETVLDLGAGAGFDAFLAAREVGEVGQVIGVDMTPEMIDKARANAEKAGIGNVEFREGLIEALPVDDDSVDAIISNCVINLSPDKPAVFREAFRVLRPGGRLAVSDIVLQRPLPTVIADSLAAWAGCVAGAALLDDYLQAIRDAGFEEPEVSLRPAVEALSPDDPVVTAVQEGVEKMSVTEGCGCGSLAEIADGVASAQVVARKPE